MPTVLYFIENILADSIEVRRLNFHVFLLVCIASVFDAVVFFSELFRILVNFTISIHFGTRESETNKNWLVRE